MTSFRKCVLTHAFSFSPRQKLGQTSQDFVVFDRFYNRNAISHIFFNGLASSSFDHLGIDIPVIHAKKPDIVNITHCCFASCSQSGELTCKEVIFLTSEHRNSKIFPHFVVFFDIRHEDSHINFNFDVVVGVAI